jgi:hypothetical protein
MRTWAWDPRTKIPPTSDASLSQREQGLEILHLSLDELAQPALDLARFAEAFVDLGTVCWPNELDLAPELLYEKVSGRPLSV